MLVRRVRATGRNLTGNNLAIIAVGSYLSFLVSALLAGVIAAICGYASDSPARIAGALGAIAAAGAAVIWIGGQEEQREEREAAELRQPDSQAARITHAQSLLREAGDRIARTLTETTATIQKAVDSTTGIVDALQDELRTNRAAIDTLIDQARAAEQAAAEADARAAIGQEGAKAVDAQLSVNIQVPGLGVAVGDRWLRFSGGPGVAVVAGRGFRDSFRL